MVRIDERLGGAEFTIVVLPDTQLYLRDCPGLFITQTGWIAAHAAALNVKYVFHLGDVVQNNTDHEWTRAASAMSLLDGVVPYVISPGNHDCGVNGNADTRDTGLNTFFSFEAISAWVSFGGAYQKGVLDNTYHLFTAGGRDFIVLVLEWGPRDEVIEWANAVMTRHVDRAGILVVHAYLNNDGLRYDHDDKSRRQDYNPHDYRTPGVNDGEELWQKLVRRHPFIMTLNGHVVGSGTGYLKSRTDTGTVCHQMLANYQMRSLGGEGYLRVLKFMPDRRTVEVVTYSPFYDSFLTETDQAFRFTL